MTSKIGLTGLYQPHCSRDDYTSVYMISDEDTGSLFVFVLFPGCYNDVYEIAFLTEYTKIFLIPISLNPAYMSDIYRLVNDLVPIKEMVKVMYPDHFPTTGLNTLFLNSFVRGDSKTSYVYSDNGFISFDWKNDNPINGKHDIYCTFGDKRILLTSQYVDVERIEKFFEEDLVDYVYVPWQSPEYTTENFTNFVTVMSYLSHKPYGGKIIPYGFGNLEAINYAKEFFPDNMPVTVRHLFENERPEEEEICMTWSETYNLPHRPEPPKPHCPLMHPHHHHHHHHCHPAPPPRKGWIPGPPPPMGEPFWQGPAYCPPCPPRPLPWKPPVEGDYENPSVFDIAVAEIIAACPNFESWIQTCELGCEECPLKAYVDAPTEENPESPLNPDTPSEGDSTETGSGETSTDSEIPTDTTVEENPDSTVTNEETKDTGSEVTNEPITEETTPETTENPIETATTLMS